MIFCVLILCTMFIRN